MLQVCVRIKEMERWLWGLFHMIKFFIAVDKMDEKSEQPQTLLKSL